MKNNENRLTWSKGNLIVTGTIFVTVLLFTFFMYINSNIDNTYDVAALVAAISVSGGIFGSNLVWYSKKAASENQYKLRMSLFRDASNVRLEYNEKMIIMMKKHEVSTEEVDAIDNLGDMDEFMQGSIEAAVEALDNMQRESDAPDQIEPM